MYPPPPPPSPSCKLVFPMDPGQPSAALLTHPPPGAVWYYIGSLGSLVTAAAAAAAAEEESTALLRAAMSRDCCAITAARRASPDAAFRPTVSPPVAPWVEEESPWGGQRWAEGGKNAAGRVWVGAVGRRDDADSGDGGTPRSDGGRRGKRCSAEFLLLSS